ncbi:hypothetical protein [Paenibacillus sp. OV219]|uniref:hypothetical protein n=1 Tax=Paenibacillus sp. OV219 TaxID=1884377 RepID=UPI0008C46821|nr:hypothetical protein [Paenibacillus sp. OV219]SEN59101.1 hypothetical protein SAMN05518847_103276 [Paenibacillus sp. OV219]
MNYIVYFILDCLDTLAITFVMFSIFQYPIREYLREILIIVCILAVTSIIGRELLRISPVYDSLNHIVLLIAGLRIFMKVKLYRSLRIVGVGMIGYFAIQICIVAMVAKTGLLDSSMLYQSNSTEVRLVQLISQAVTFTVAYCIVKFNLGIAKYIRPPHDFYLDTRMSKEKLWVYFGTTVALLVLSLSFHLLVERFEIIEVFIIANILFIIVIMFTYRRDATIERNRLFIE